MRTILVLALLLPFTAQAGEASYGRGKGNAAHKCAMDRERAAHRNGERTSYAMLEQFRTECGGAPLRTSQGTSPQAAPSPSFTPPAVSSVLPPAIGRFLR